MDIKTRGRAAAGYTKFGLLSVLSFLIYGLLGYILVTLLVVPAAFAYGFTATVTGSAAAGVAMGVVALVASLALYGYASDRIEWIPTP